MKNIIESLEATSDKNEIHLYVNYTNGKQKSALLKKPINNSDLASYFRNCALVFTDFKG